jgi:hypothetical protein
MSFHRVLNVNLFFFLAPLQPLGLNGRNRIPPKNGPIPSSLSFPHQQQTNVLPPTASLQSLSPLTPNPTINIEEQTTSSEYDEKERLKNDLIQLKNELQKSKETIARLQKSEEQMRER